jgi:hypothetical protein
MSTESLAPHVVAAVNGLLGAPGRPYASHARRAPTPTAGLIWTEWPGEVDEALAAVRGAVRGEPVVTYKRIRVWQSPYAAEAQGIVVCPARDPYDILRIEMGFYPSADEVIPALQAFDREYGLTLEGADYATVEFTLRRVPAGAEAEALSARLKAFSPDVLYATGEEHFDLRRRDGRIVLWWD